MLATTHVAVYKKQQSLKCTEYHSGEKSWIFLRIGEGASNIYGQKPLTCTVYADLFLTFQFTSRALIWFCRSMSDLTIVVSSSESWSAISVSNIFPSNLSTKKKQIDHNMTLNWRRKKSCRFVYRQKLKFRLVVEYAEVFFLHKQSEIITRGNMSLSFLAYLSMEMEGIHLEFKSQSNKTN